MFAGKKSAQIREILISESAWEEMTCLFAPSLEITPVSDDSKPEILQLLNSVKEHIAELDQEIAVFCQKND
ncbi:hypothetical protein HVZ41_06625 [Escherichia coli]|nr:hypothetical protein HVZ41_06625 [Escherichia coli]